MQTDYIRKEDAKDALQEKVFHNLTDEFYGAMQVLDELEPADVVQVVRCKDCYFSYPEHNYHCTMWGASRPKEGFCHLGKPREG